MVCKEISVIIFIHRRLYLFTPLLLMYRILIALVCVPALCYGQAGGVAFGLSADLSSKVNTLSMVKMTDKNISFATRLDAVLMVKGVEEAAMTFMLSAGIRDDARPFGISVSNTVKMNLYFMTITRV